MAKIKNKDKAVHCVVCGDPVPYDRVAQGAITCKKEHGADRANMLRARKDARECRYCHKPSTPEDRTAYIRFRRLERKQPHLLYPTDFQTWSAEQENPAHATPELFANWWNEKKLEDANDDIDIAPDQQEAPSSPERQWYVLRQDIFGKKGEICEILQTKGVGNGLTQLRFADGFSPVLNRAAIRRAKPSELKALDEKAWDESKLLASGNPTGGD